MRASRLICLALPLLVGCATLPPNGPSSGYSFGQVWADGARWAAGHPERTSATAHGISMLPFIGNNSVLQLEANPAKVKPGDIVLAGGRAHAVVRVVGNIIVTQGFNNARPDPPLAIADVSFRVAGILFTNGKM